MAKPLKIVVAVSVALALSVAATSCIRKEAGKKKAPAREAARDENAAAPEDAVQHKVLSFNLEGFTDKGAKKWDVTGQCAEAISATEVKLDHIVAKAYGDEGEATITADSGIYDKAKNNVRLQTNVKATIQTTEGVNAGFLEAGKKEKSAAKKGDVLPGEEKKKNTTVITCDGDVQFDYENNIAYFNKNVVVVTDDGTIIADKITVILDPDSKKLKTIMAEGNVKIFKEGNTIYSERATYIEAEKKIILSGKPKIILDSQGGADTNIFGSTGIGGKPPAAPAAPAERK